MTLPTGGIITYNYSSFSDSFNNQNRWISSIVKDGGTTVFTPSVVSKCSSKIGCEESITVSSPSGSDTVYTFNLDKAGLVAGSSWVQGIQTFQGSAQGGQLLRSTSTSYRYQEDYFTNVSGFIIGTYETPVGTTNTVTLSDKGVTSQTQTTSIVASPLPNEVKVWDFGALLGGAPTTDTNYQYNDLNFATSVVALDGSGHQLSKATYGYDESAVTSSSSVPNHGAAPGDQRGNLTSQHQWINTSNTTLDTAMTYDDAGALLTSTAPEGITTYGHDATDTFVTSATAPTPTSGATLTAGTGYDPSTGVALSTTDPNGQTTSYKGYDAFNRVGEVDSPDGGVTKVSYPDPGDVVEATAFNGAGSGTTVKRNDAYGRPSRIAIANGQPAPNQYYQQDTCYDTTGRVSFQSYQYQGPGFSTAPVCSGAGDTYTYDALGRTKSVTHGDGTSSNYSYTGRATETTDENGVSKITQTDAFGRITTACELSSNATMPASGSPVSCGTDIAGTGFVTSYSYNPAAFQTAVTQGAQTRVFTSDSLGREVSAQEPESGLTGYSYAYNAIGLLATRTKPRANQTDPNVRTTTQTQYDALGRVVSVNYNDGTAAKLYSYDKAVDPSDTNVLGRLAQQGVATAAGAAIESFGYDPMGRTNQVTTCTPASCGKFNTVQNYAYDYAGNMTQASDGVGATLLYGYTPANQIQGIGGLAGPFSASIVSNVVNGPNGPVSYRLGNGLNQIFRYNTLGGRDGGWVCAGSTSQFCRGGTQLYGYTITAAGGRVNQACDTVLNNCGVMSYDSFNRLTARKTTSGVGADASWSYDRYGNRWTQTVEQGGFQQQLSFDTGTNRAVGFSYDAAGNLLSDTVHSYSYDAEGNMVAVDGGATSSYSYDAANHRVHAVIDGKTYEEVYNLAGQKVGIAQVNADGSETVVEENGRWGASPLAVYQNGQLNYEHQDWIGTERLLTDASGKPAGGYASLPFGDGYMSQGADIDPYHYAGLDHDYESGLDHAQYREYANAGGRWLSPDPYAGSYNWADPQSLNRYLYVENNPLSASDPSGLFTNGASGGGGDDGLAGFLSDLVVQGFEDLFSSFLGGPSFHGSLLPRPSVPPEVTTDANGDYHLYVNANGSPLADVQPANNFIGAGFFLAGGSIGSLAPSQPVATKGPHFCGAGAFVYGGRSLDAGPVNGFAGGIIEADTSSGISKGALFELGGGEGYIGGAGKIVSPNSAGLGSANLVYGGVGVGIPGAHVAGGLVGFSSGGGFFAEISAAGSEFGIGLYADASTGGCH